MIIKKEKLRCMASLKNIKGIVKCYSNNGWINSGIMKLFLDHIYNYTKGNHCVLLLDKYPSHTTDCVMEYAETKNIKLLFVPTGTTSLYQPLDVGINGPLKSCARKLWKNSVHKNPKFIPTLNTAMEHLSKAINLIINEEIIKKAFSPKHCH